MDDMSREGDPNYWGFPPEIAQVNPMLDASLEDVVIAACNITTFLEREARIEREVRLRRAEIELRRADVDDRRRELEIVRRERQTRGVSAEARRALEESRARTRVSRERLRRNYEGLRREDEGPYMEAEAMAQVEVLREILRRLDDDGAASRHLEELESSLEELLRRRADEAERQEGSP